jgi:hypothetical protein
MLIRPLAEYYGFKMESRSISERKDVDECFCCHGDRSEGSKFAVVIRVLVPLCAVLMCLDLFMGYVMNQDICYTLPLISNAHFEEFEVYCDNLSLSPDEDFETFDSGSKNRLSVSVNTEGKYVCKSKNFGDLTKKLCNLNGLHLIINFF